MSTAIQFDFLAKVIENGSPAEEGARLARALLAKDDADWSDLTVDFRGMPFELLGISFFYGFLQQIASTRPETLERARKVKWTLSYSGLDEIVAAYVARFQPRGAVKRPSSAAA
jgi:hypothetical protein